MINNKLTDAIARYVLNYRFKLGSTTTSSPSPATLKNKGFRQGSNQGGVIAGAVTGSLLMVALVMVGILFFRHHRKMNGQYSSISLAIKALPYYLICYAPRYVYNIFIVWDDSRSIELPR